MLRNLTENAHKKKCYCESQRKFYFETDFVVCLSSCYYLHYRVAINSLLIQQISIINLGHSASHLEQKLFRVDSCLDWFYVSSNN